MSVAALVLGIVAFVIAFVPFLNFITWIPAVLAVVFGIIGLVQKGKSKVLPAIGTALGGLALILGIVMPIAYAAAFVSAVDDAIDEGTGIIDVPAGEEGGDSGDGSSDLGTRENPVPIGTTIELGTFGETSYEVTPGAPTLDANAVIAAENQFNAAPAAGSQYVILPLDLTYVGAESGTPWIDISVSFVGSDGNTYDQAFAVVATPLTDVGEMFNGASAQGNLVFEVPSDVIEGGTWSISLLFGDPIYFTSH